MASAADHIWRKIAIEEAKRDIRFELEQIRTAAGEAARLHHILEQIEASASTTKPKQLLKRFIYTVSALVHHQRYGGLHKKQIHDLFSLGQAILKVARVSTGHSPNAFLHAELHSALSDIHYSEGEFLAAIWERQLASQIAVLPSEHEARQNLGMGICALRLGSAASAIQFFKKGMQETQDPAIHGKLQLHLIKAERLSARSEDLRTQIMEAQLRMQDPTSLGELSWEKACLNLSRDGDLNELFSLTRRGGLLHAASYLLELFFWSYAHPKTEWMQRFQTLSSLGSKRSLGFDRSSLLFSLAQSLEQAYDTDIPFSKRLSDIKKVLPKISLLGSVDQELLVWLALTRWLYRARYYPMARLCFYEYESLARKLSGGVSGDVLGIAGDFIKVDWEKKTA